MGRLLLIFDTWGSIHQKPLEIDRALLLDYGVQFPGSILGSVPEIEPVVRAYGLDKRGISDLFAARRFSSAREQLLATATDMIARNMITGERVGAEEPAYNVTSIGRTAASRFCSPFSQAIRGLSEVLSRKWARSNLRTLSIQLRDAVQDHASAMAGLVDPIAPWTEDDQ